MSELSDTVNKAMKEVKTEIRTGKRILSQAVFIFFLLLSLHFWDLRFIPKIFNIENLLTWMVCGFSFFMVINKNDMHFRNAILLFIFGLLLNSLAAYINLDQDFKLSVLSFGFYYFILLYFLQHYLELDRRFLENVIIIFGLIYSALFLTQYALYPFSIFNRDVSTAVNEIQLEILGNGFLMLSYFLVLNRYLLNRRFLNIVLAIGFLFILLKSGFRTLVGGALMVTVIMIMRMFRFRVKDFVIVIFLAAFFIGLFQVKSVAGIVNKMINKTETDIGSGSKFNRIVDMEFFFKRYPENLSYFIIGGGRASGKNLYRYNPYVMGQNYNIVWVDIGLLGFYIVVGGVATLGLLWYTIKAIFSRLPGDMIYLSSYFLYLLIVSFTNEEIYRNGIFSVVAIGLYLIDIAQDRSTDPDLGYQEADHMPRRLRRRIRGSY